MSRGVLLVISGPSGSGKGTVVRELVNRYDDIFLSVSMTTRQPREGEVHAKDYYFVSREVFQDMIDRGEMLEYETYVNNMYGTPATPVRDRNRNGEHCVLEIDTRGGKSVKERRPDTVLVFLAAPSVDELERRLRKRGTETDDVIRQRLTEAKREYRSIRDYDYIVVNDDVDSAVEKLRAIIIAETCRVHSRVRRERR